MNNIVLKHGLNVTAYASSLQHPHCVIISWIATQTYLLRLPLRKYIISTVTDSEKFLNI